MTTCRHQASRWGRCWASVSRRRVTRVRSTNSTWWSGAVSSSSSSSSRQPARGARGAAGRNSPSTSTRPVALAATIPPRSRLRGTTSRRGRPGRLRHRRPGKTHGDQTGRSLSLRSRIRTKRRPTAAVRAPGAGSPLIWRSAATPRTSSRNGDGPSGKINVGGRLVLCRWSRRRVHYH